MTGIKALNPIVVSVFFAFVIIFAMFTMNPVVTAISLCASLAARACIVKNRNGKMHIYTSVMVILCMLLNPLFSHNGATVLLVVNNSAVTLEVLLYGLFAGLIVAGTVYWSQVFAEIMTSDKIIYCVGFLSHKSALVISMALRFVPMYINKAKQINNSQKALGLYKDETIISRVKGTMRVFSALLTYMIEKTIISSDSMSARGADGGKRTNYRIYGFSKRDALSLISVLLLSAFTVAASLGRKMEFSFYPYISGTFDRYGIAGFISYTLLCFCPTLLQGGDTLKWHCFRSKISPSPIPQVRKY